MANCKVCACGTKVMYPYDFCISCGRDLMSFPVFDEEDEKVKELLSNSKTAEESSPASKEKENYTVLKTDEQDSRYVLRLENGEEISIPSGGGIIGRSEIGSETLAVHRSVSRQHIRVKIRGSSANLLIEDISRYGTLINGEKIKKNELVRVKNGDRITLCNLDTELIDKEEII